MLQLDPNKKKQLDSNIKSMLDNGASQEDVIKYANDFKEKFSVKKKDGTNAPSTSTSVSPKQVSEQTNGSSGSQEFEYKPVYDERGREVKIKNKKGELVPYMEKVPKGFASSTEEREIVRQEQKQKASKPIVSSSNLKKYQESTKVSDEEKATLQKEVSDEFDKKGFWNGIADGTKKGFNFLADTFTTIGTFGTETEASKSVRMETDSFAKEKKQAEQELIASKQPVTPESIAEKAKEIKLNKKLEGLVVDKNNKFLSELSPEEIKSLNLERVKQYKTLSDKDKYIATQAEILKNNFEKDTKDYTTAVAIIKKNKEQGIETNQALIDFAIEKENSLKEKLNEVKKLEAEYISNKENIGSAEEEIDFLKRNYDTADKVKTLAKIGFGDIYNTVANKLPLMVSDLDQAIFEPLRPGSSEGVLSDDERQELIDKAIDWETAKELAKSNVKKDVDFENLSLSNFGQFFAQELGTQIPVFAQMAMPGGVVSIGMTSAFEKYGRMEQESNNIAFEFNGKQFTGFEKENGEIIDSLGNTYDPKEVNITSIRESDKSTANKFFTSVTFGTAEAVLGAMPTKNIFGRALNSLSTSGKKTLFRQSVKEFVKAKGTGVLNDTATEVVSEGATQIIQNIADISSGKKDVSIYDGVDHAMVSAGMLSFLMSATPAVAGLALKPFSESKENKQVNENLQEIFALQSQLNNTELSNISRTTIENKIKDLEKSNSEVLDKIASRTKGISKEVFDAIKDVNKKQELLILQASEISKDNNLDTEIKKKIIADLESEFNALETKRNKLASGKSTILDALSDNESARLKEKAANILLNEEKAKGKTDEEINFTEEQINKKAIEIYKQDAVQQEATTTETKQEAQPQAEIQKTEQEVIEKPSKQKDIEAKKAEIEKLEKEKQSLQGNRTEINVGDTFNYNFGIARDGLVTVIRDNNDGTVQTRYADGTIKTERKSNLIDYLNEQNGVYNEINKPDNTAKSIEINSKIDKIKKEIQALEQQKTSQEVSQNSTAQVRIYEYNGKKYNITDNGGVEVFSNGNENMIPLDMVEEIEKNGNYLGAINNIEVLNETAQSQVDNVDGNVQPGNNIVEPSGTTEQENNQASNIQPADNGRNVEKEKITSKKEDNIIIEGDDLILKHGTPHNFDQFQLEKIGTGEGAQAFGYGLYFTDGSKIAESYAKKLSEDKTGIVYTVRIKNGRTSNWADWREPLNQEQEEVLYNSLTKEERAIYQEHLDKAFYPDSPKYDMKYEKEYHGTFDDLRIDKDGFASYEKQSAAGLIYMDLKDAFGQEKATEILKRSGIDGIRYKAKRGYGQETNYVVFNPESISIESKSNEKNKLNQSIIKREIKIADKGQSYTVEKVDGVIVITDKKGKKPSKVTERKILDEYVKTINFTQGTRVDDSFESSEETYIDDVATKSQNPSEIAEAIAYVENADMNEGKVDPIQIAIANALGEKSVEKSSFTNINDRNNINQSIALQYFAQKGKGKGLDQIAMEVEYEVFGDYNANNPRITEEDVANFIVDNPRGAVDFLNRNKNEALEKLKTAFTDVTGLPAKPQFIETAINQNTAFKNEIFNGNSLYLYSDEDLLSLQNQREEFEKSIKDGNQSENKQTTNEIAEGINNQPDNKDGKQTPGIQKDSGTGYRAKNEPEVTPEEKSSLLDEKNKKDEFDNTDLEDDTEIQSQGFLNGSNQNKRDLALSKNGPVKLRLPFQKIFKRVWANTFKSNSGLSKESGEVVRSRNRILATYTDHINQESKEFDKIIKSVKKEFPKEFNQKLIEINNYLSGDKNADISFLNQEQIDKLDYFRDRIDSLSKSLITLLEDKMSSMKNKEAIESTKELIETIKQNMGIYITRNYQIFSDDNYRDMITGDFEKINKEGQLRIRNAINYLIREEGLTKDEATKSVAEYLAEIRRKKNDFFVQSSGNAVSNFFKKRKGIPKEFRELLGESKDPIYNYINTVYKISQYLGNIEYQYNLREHLINNQIASLEPKLGYEKIVGSSEGWRILNDIYVPVEFKEAFDDMQPLQTIESGFYKAWIKIAGIVKINKTILSPTTAARNFLSGIFLGANSGHFFLLKPSSAANAWNQAWATKKTKKELFNERQKLIKLGVLGDGANSGELMALLNDFSKEVDRMINKNAFELFFEKAKDLYAFGDDFYKVSGFYIERDRLIKSGLSESEAENKAAYRISNGYPTYSYLPKNIQRLRRLPLIGTFVSFPYETIRSTKNNIYFIKEDLEEGRTKMAYQRAAGMIVANATLGGLNMLTMSMLGLTDDDDNAIRDMLPEWQKNSKLIYLGTKNEKPIFIDGTALFPSEVIFKPLSILLEKRKGREFEDKLKIATNEVLSPYISKDISFKTLTEIFENENEFNEKIYLSDNLLEGVFNESEKILNYLMRQAGPGVYNNITEFFRANEIKPNFFGDKFSSYGKEYTNQEALLGLLGFRISTLNYNAAMSSYAYQVKKSETEDKSSSNKLVKTSKKLTNDEIKAIVEDYAKYHNENYEQMVNIVYSGKKLGMSDDEIKKSLKLSKISDNDIQYLLKGKVPKLSPMSAKTKSNFKEKLKINYKGKNINNILNNFESNFRKMNIEIKQYNRTKIE